MSLRRDPRYGNALLFESTADRDLHSREIVREQLPVGVSRLSLQYLCKHAARLKRATHRLPKPFTYTGELDTRPQWTVDSIPTIIYQRLLLLHFPLASRTHTQTTNSSNGRTVLKSLRHQSIVNMLLPLCITHLLLSQQHLLLWALSVQRLRLSETP